MHSLSLYTSCIFSLVLNDDIVDTEKPDEICSPTSFVNDVDFPGICLQPSIFYIKDSKSA